MLWRRSLRRTAAADRRRQRVLPGGRPAVRRPRRRDAPHRVPQGRHRPVPAVLGVPIVPDLRAGQTVLVAAHGNSLRALVKHLDGISDEDIAGLNIPTGMPLVYELDDSMRADGRRRRRTSTPRPPPRRPPPSPTRAADATSSRLRKLPERRSSPCDVQDPMGRAERQRVSIVEGLPEPQGADLERDRVLAGDDEDDPVRHGDRVVGDPLVVPAEQGDVDGGLDTVLPVVRQQHREAVAAQLVHLVVGVRRGERARSTSRSRDDLGDSARPCSSATRPISSIVGLDVLRERRAAGTRSRAIFATCTREVAHPLELVRPSAAPRPPSRRSLGDRLLQRQQRERLLLDLLARRSVDLGVGADDLLGDLGVAV